MAKEYARTQRVGDFLQREIARLVQQEIRDPRLGMVSITGVQVTRDLAHAKVFFTALDADSPEEAQESTEVLNRAAGFLRTQLARGSTLRSVPQLQFRFDSSVGQGRRMEKLLQRAEQADREIGLRAADEEGRE